MMQFVTVLLPVEKKERKEGREGGREGERKEERRKKKTKPKEYEHILALYL